jgi:hypothetical protein
VIGGLAVLAVLAGHRAEGAPFNIQKAPSEYYLTMGRCRREAQARNPSGGARYMNFECTEKWLWFTLARETYSDGVLYTRIE